MAQENAEAGQRFLDENAGKEGVQTTESGLQYQVLEEGSGPKPSAGDTVRVHYRGTLLDGETFDDSYARGEPVIALNCGAGLAGRPQLMPVGQVPAVDPGSARLRRGRHPGRPDRSQRHPGVRSRTTRHRPPRRHRPEPAGMHVAIFGTDTSDWSAAPAGRGRPRGHLRDVDQRSKGFGGDHRSTSRAWSPWSRPTMRVDEFTTDAGEAIAGAGSSSSRWARRPTGWRRPQYVLAVARTIGRHLQAPCGDKSTVPVGNAGARNIAGNWPRAGYVVFDVSNPGS